MLKQIILLFPKNDVSAQKFYSELSRLFSEIPTAKIEGTQIVLKSSFPQDALPEIVLQQSEGTYPLLKFLSFSHKEYEEGTNTLFDTILSQNGENIQQSSLTTISGLVEKLGGHIVRVDHVGLNIPSARMTRAAWEHMLHIIAQMTTIYHYPSGEPWPFIIPATQSEFENGIENFMMSREPKFELVYDEYVSIPTFQFDIKTDFTRTEVERLFPDPIGVSFNGLEDFFRAVYVASPWPGMQMRFDVSFRSDDPSSDWSTGRWLVQEGGRVE